MQELITKLTEKVGISPEQANTAIQTIKDFIIEKFPMMAGAVDNFFPASGAGAASQGADSATTGADDTLDKLSGMLGGGIK